MIDESRVFDRTNYYNKWGFFQRFTSACNSWRYQTGFNQKSGIKRTCELRLAAEAVLGIGSGSTLNDNTFSKLDLPSKKIYIRSNIVINRSNVRASNKLVRLGGNILTCFNAMIGNHQHSMRSNHLTRDQPARIGHVVNGGKVWISAGETRMMNPRIRCGVSKEVNAAATNEKQACAVSLGVDALTINNRAL